MMEKEYNLYSEFDLDKHNEKYHFYLEAVIFPSGKVEYAVPSHQEKLISIYLKSTGKSREDLYEECPKEYYLDYNQWLCNITNCISVWYDYIMVPEQGFTYEQLETIERLTSSGAYSGRGLEHLQEIGPNSSF